VCNVPGMNWKMAKRVFFKGRGIAIAEPLYQVAGDGAPTVRVNNPDEISHCDIPKTVAEWRHRGNECFKERRYKEAQVLYTRGWEGNV